MLNNLSEQSANVIGTRSFVLGEPASKLSHN